MNSDATRRSRRADYDQQVAKLAHDLVHGAGEHTSALFAAHGLMAPLRLWSPSRHDLHHPLHRSFAARITEVMEDDGGVSVDEFSGLDLRDHQGWLMLVEPVPGGGGFRYRHYGENIAAVFGQDMTGAEVRDIDTFISPFFHACYATVTDRRKWLLTVHEAPRHIFARAWRRLLVPLVDRDGAVARIAALNVADNDLSDGLEVLPDPVLIATRGGRIVFANNAARARFGEPGPVSKPSSLESYLGAPVELPDAESDLSRLSPAVTDMSAVIDGILIHFCVSVRMITYRDRPYAVVSLQPG